MATSDPTYVGQVASVTGGVVRVRLRRDMPTTLVLVEGESYRVGQIGGFFRIPLGYTHLYAVCTQVGADAVPGSASARDPLSLEIDNADQGLAGYRWMTVVLFGESVSRIFERGVGQYPTVGDEVHFVTSDDLSIVYGRSSHAGTLTVGSIASTGGIPASLDLNKFVTRHAAVVGSTGAGKSNLVRVLIEALASPDFPTARVLVIDPHGEYGGVAPQRTKVFRITPGPGEHRLLVPFWALPFDELLAITFGPMTPANEAALRDRVQELKREGASLLPIPPQSHSITADSPVPFSLKRLWFEYDDFERQTFKADKTLTAIVAPGDAESLTSNIYEPYKPGSKEPMKNPSPRHLTRQLELAKSRMSDARYSFIFDPKDGYSPDNDGRIAADLPSLVRSWVGHEGIVTVLDVSELPSEVASDVVGLLVRTVYDTLFWAGSSPVSGRSQPLLIVVDEAHRFVPEGEQSSAHRILTKIAKEGRKYGVGLTVVTQRPSEIDSTILSQCGTMIALRTTNPNDRAKVAGAFPDDLGGLVDLLPSLRTGEGLFVGEAIFVPSRVRIKRSQIAEAGNDPNVFKGWTRDAKPEGGAYEAAVRNWRNQTKAPQ
jgi:DNA helicase HerA-like ATPase